MKPENETKLVKIAGVDYPVKKSARTLLKFEELSGHSIDLFDGTTKDSINFIYSCFWGGGSRISFDEFLDLIDDEDIDKLVNLFVVAFSEPATEKKTKAR